MNMKPGLEKPFVNKIMEVKNMLINTGYLEYEELKSIQKLPDDKQYSKGPIAVIECVQQIPCNPCESSCPKGAIQIGKPIINLPNINFEKCVGCGQCIAKCPGMAIFVIDKSYSDINAKVSFPYEYYPIPEINSCIKAVDRKGDVVCDGKVVKVLSPESFDHTCVITVEIPKKFADEVRSIKREGF